MSKKSGHILWSIRQNILCKSCVQYPPPTCMRSILRETNVLISSVLSLTDVDCLVIDLQYIECSWKTHWTPDVNYTFYSRFQFDALAECANYMTEKGMKIGCQQPSDDLLLRRFSTFYTVLEYENDRISKEHDLRTKSMYIYIKLNPPTNLTVQNNSDSNLCFEWNKMSRCAESEVRYRMNNNSEWMVSDFNPSRPSVIFLDSCSELQVRSRIDASCGQSLWWSDWSEPVVWESNKRQGNNTSKKYMEQLIWVQFMALVFSICVLVFPLEICPRSYLSIDPLMACSSSTNSLYIYTFIHYSYTFFCSYQHHLTQIFIVFTYSAITKVAQIKNFRFLWNCVP
uniref:Cytokine receptor-like factor 2-like D1 domain-containing protein n=1 Tax=Sphaeramia orbicularis TaxID=375764 RepID=A0A672ZW65_9TELE